MKKFLSALAAAALLCCTLVSPASAAETYKMGDVDMDGKITSDDAQLVLEEYTQCVLGKSEDHILTQERLALAYVTPETVIERYFAKNGRTHEEAVTAAMLTDAQLILVFYTESLSDESIKTYDVLSWFENHLNYWEDT